MVYEWVRTFEPSLHDRFYESAGGPLAKCVLWRGDVLADSAIYFK